ncbi:IS3 family transposase [Flavobacterium sp. C3NV]|uniref:IS3 family transposase n=1 Tax=Flavobacterium sp. C3NV TaxID=3393358 RepID=UPI0039902DB9
MVGKYKKYDRSFKRDVVKLSYEKNDVKQLAEELGILPSLLSRWRNEYLNFGEGSFPGSGYVRVNPEQKIVFELEKKSKGSQIRFEILKNASPYVHQGKLEVYKFIKKNEKKYSIAEMCRVLEVGNGRYLRWKYNGVSDKQKQIALLKGEIKSIFLDFKKYQGGNKITQVLNNRGYKISRRQVSFYMKELGLRKIAKRKFIATTDSNHTYYTSPNVVNRVFKANIPSKVWVSDITYIQTKNGFLYLTIIMDLYDRKIIGWSLGNHLTTLKTTLPAWEMAIVNRKVSNGLIFHSDRGVQYANKAFTNKLDSYGCIRSMSRKADHLDNAVSESFFSSFKRELINKKDKLLTQKKMKEEIFDYIENWYNKKRRHSTLNYKTIEEFNSINNFEESF